jgi:CheY-like chemotaxis protein
MVEKMDSEIKVKSAKHQGAEFWFEIDTPAQPILTSQQLVSQEGGSIEGMRILLAEDNTVNILIARQILSLWNTRVIEAKNGKEAVDLAANQQFDVILMDLHMPELSGIEAARILRQQGVLTPIIALTADALFDSKNDCIAAGMNAFVTKPFNPKELHKLLAGIHQISPANSLP